MLASLNQEASLLSDILQLKLQLAALATGGLQNPGPSNADHVSSHPDAPGKAKLHSAKKKTSQRESGNAA